MGGCGCEITTSFYVTCIWKVNNVFFVEIIWLFRRKTIILQSK